MKIIGIVHSKGGVGKSMLARVLGAGLTSFGFKVVIMDADQQGSSKDWYDQALQAGLLDYTPHVASVPGMKFREQAQRNYPGHDVVIIDTIGTKHDKMAAVTLSSAIQDADLVLTPLDPCSRDDQKDLGDIEATFLSAAVTRPDIQFRYVLSKLNTLRTKGQQSKVADFALQKAEQGFQVLPTPMYDRPKYEETVGEGKSPLFLPRKDPARLEMISLTVDVARALGLPITEDEIAEVTNG